MPKSSSNSAVSKTPVSSNCLYLMKVVRPHCMAPFFLFTPGLLPLSPIHLHVPGSDGLSKDCLSSSKTHFCSLLVRYVLRVTESVCETVQTWSSSDGGELFSGDVEMAGPLSKQPA